MSAESTGFTEADVASFVTDYLNHERDLLVTRLRAVCDEVEALAPVISSGNAASHQGWEPNEVLAHMATSSQFFGWLAHRVATGQEVGDVLPMIQMRDDVTSEAAGKTPSELAEQLRKNLERTIAFIEATDPMKLRQTFDYVGIPMSAEDVIRIPLASHLETHVQQIRAALP